MPEIQFRKYADPTAEQLNDCGTLRWCTASRFAAPIMVRMPGGFFKCGDNLTAGFGAEIAATLTAEAFLHLDAPIERPAMPDVSSPHFPLLLEAVLPTAARIGRATQHLVSL